MSAPRVERSKTGWSFGATLVAIGISATLLARAIPVRALGGHRDPGPRAYPTVLGILLIAGGIFELLQAWRTRSRGAPGLDATGRLEAGGADASAADRSQAEFNRGGIVDGLLILGAVVLYVPAIGWLGFAPSTALFCVGVMRRLGARWLSAVVAAIALVVVVEVLFVKLFQVQLPAGRFGFP